MPAQSQIRTSPRPQHCELREAVSDVAVEEIVDRMQEHVRDVPGVNGHSILVEEGGMMVVLTVLVQISGC
jgi:hypothetical protein